MARLARLTLGGQLHHVIQRGNNRQPIFLENQDHVLMLELLASHSRQFGVAVHGYVLMPNHFHLLTTPTEMDGLSQMMQAVGRAYVRRFNRLHGRSGTLWEGRYRCNILEASTYFLSALVSLETNPVRSGLVAQPTDYPWSSHAHHVGMRADKLVTPHQAYWTLGNTPFAREAAYADLVRNPVPAHQQEALMSAALQGWALGSEPFIEELQKVTDRRLIKRKPGRPIKAKNEE